MARFQPDSFEAQVLQRLTALEVEVRNLKAELSDLKGTLGNRLNRHRVDVPVAGGLGGTIAVAVFILARLLGLL